MLIISRAHFTCNAHCTCGIPGSYHNDSVFDEDCDHVLVNLQAGGSTGYSPEAAAKTPEVSPTSQSQCCWVILMDCCVNLEARQFALCLALDVVIRTSWSRIQQALDCLKLDYKWTLYKLLWFIHHRYRLLHIHLWYYWSSKGVQSH